MIISSFVLYPRSPCWQNRHTAGRTFHVWQHLQTITRSQRLQKLLQSMPAGHLFAEKASKTSMSWSTHSACSPRPATPLSLEVRGDLISSFVPTRLGQLPTKHFSKEKLTSRPFSCWRAGEAQASNGRCRGTTALSPDASPRNADTFRRDRKGRT